ncbi:hypothetical protein [Sulfitobacter sp. DFL-23]|nr:hypothetical protein [Sulfitobacter sp. DFL-23]
MTRDRGAAAGPRPFFVMSDATQVVETACAKSILPQEKWRSITSG